MTTCCDPITHERLTKALIPVCIIFMFQFGMAFFIFIFSALYFWPYLTLQETEIALRYFCLKFINISKMIFYLILGRNVMKKNHVYFPLFSLSIILIMYRYLKLSTKIVNNITYGNIWHLLYTKKKRNTTCFNTYGTPMVQHSKHKFGT